MSKEALLNQKLLKFSTLLVQKEYFQAHELLEIEWRNVEKNRQEKVMLKGLINGATLLEHYRRKHEIQARRIHSILETKYADISKIKPYTPFVKAALKIIHETYHSFEKNNPS